MTPPAVPAGTSHRLRLNLLRDHDEECARLRAEILGFLPGSKLDAPPNSKEAIRLRHADQRQQLLGKMNSFLVAFEDLALADIARGSEVDPTQIVPEVSLVKDDRDNKLFSYAILHWSIPVSGGYGRRSRFLVRDRQNGKLIGVFALSDPVYNLGARDRAIGWRDERKRIGLYHVLDASVVGAMRPYSDLLGGKLIALSVISRQTLDLIASKYIGTKTVYKKRTVSEPKPVLITTTSALGRSSVYNRIRQANRRFYVPVGWTEGYGHFDVPEVLFRRMVLVLEESGYAKAHANAYGMGPSWRMRTIRAAMEYLKIDPNLALKHGIRRQVFAAPTAVNWREFLLGEQTQPVWFDDELSALGRYWADRWAIPRAARAPGYLEFKPDDIRLSHRRSEQLAL